MLSPLLTAVRSRWFSTAVHVGLWCVLYLALIHLGGKTPEFRVADSANPPPPGPVPVGNMEGLFSPAQWPSPSGMTNTHSAFYTTYFVPVPAPAPPPPTTRKVAVTYQGFYEAGDTVKHVIVKIDDSYVAAVIGGPVTTNLFVADASLQNLVLTNQSAQTNLILLNAKREIEVPIK
ncbi:MAG TPA: hypothetical protein VKY92_09230 [Verrucomicrobiae bacterium]|jgi:hypothetical protein|nr:hypothetical protein [Verrucomicrobiae bacterium]